MRAVNRAAALGRKIWGLLAMDENVWQTPEDGLVTGSRLRMWWLVHFFGYRVVGQKLAPRVTFYGAMQMTPRWILSAPAALEDGF